MVGRRQTHVSHPQVVATLVAASDALAAIVQGASGLAVRNHRSVSELLATVRTNDVALVVIDAEDRAGNSHSPAISALRRERPNLAILVYCTLSPSGSPDLLSVAREGANGFVFRGIDDVGHALRLAIQNAGRNNVGERIHAEIAPVLPTGVRPLLRYVIARYGNELSVDDAANALGVNRRTLLNRLRVTGDMGPSEFMNWTRLCLVLGLLEATSRPAEQVAVEEGFVSGASFRNMLRRYTGMTVSEVRARGGLVPLIRLFRDAIQRSRSASESVPTPSRHTGTGSPSH